nr:MAG TPA: hypothetical protein [Bacteriophage sp.]
MTTRPRRIPQAVHGSDRGRGVGRYHGDRCEDQASITPRSPASRKCNETRS